MIELQTIFGNAFTYYTDEIAHPSSYYWFLSDTGKTFGIRKTAVTDKEKKLLSLQFKSIEKPLRGLTHQERLWTDLLLEGKTDSIDLKGQFVQFIYFCFQSSVNDFEAYEDALLGFFPTSSILLWPSTKIAILIAKTDPPSLPNGKEMIELINTDFYMNVKVCFGSPINDVKFAHDLYEEERALFEIAIKAFPEKAIFNYPDLTLLHLAKRASNPLLPLSFRTLSAYLDEEDPEIRFHLECLFENNLNISTTAKDLYMHRNSLNYKLDKLKEKTGLDARKFQEALFIFFEIILKKLS